MGGEPSTDDHADLVHEEKLENTPLVHAADGLFHRIEQIIYIALGAVLSVTVLVALAGSGQLLWGGIQDWTNIDAIFEIMDRLLFVLMLVEILYTVRVSLQTGTLSSEPFLVVALIACIRRILVLSLETSNVTKPQKWTPENSELFRAAMTELGVLGGLVIIMVGSILFIRRFGRR
jgi:uncharacterized membrane protein (DUF373 family)